MGSLKFYKYAALGLLILNLSMITFFIVTKPVHHRVDKKVKDILTLDDAQHKLFLGLMEEHKALMKILNDKQRKLLKPYFNNLVDSKENSNFESILSDFQLLEREKIESTYQHFEQVKTALTQDQLVHFEKFMNHALKQILSGDQKRPPKK